MCRFVSAVLNPRLLTVVMIGIVTGGLLTACSSSRAPEDVARDRAAVLGLWKYHTNGIDELGHGTLQIHVQDGRLKARIQDRWRGTKEADVSVENGYMDVRLNQVRISGRIYGGRFEGVARDEFWDASERGNRQSGAGSFVAKRIRRASSTVDDTDYGCPSLLREQSYACSSLLADQSGR